MHTIRPPPSKQAHPQPPTPNPHPPPAPSSPHLYVLPRVPLRGDHLDALPHLQGGFERGCEVLAGGGRAAGRGAPARPPEPPLPAPPADSPAPRRRPRPCRWRWRRRRRSRRPLRRPPPAPRPPRRARGGGAGARVARARRRRDGPPSRAAAAVGTAPGCLAPPAAPVPPVRAPLPRRARLRDRSGLWGRGSWLLKRKIWTPPNAPVCGRGPARRDLEPAARRRGARRASRNAGADWRAGERQARLPWFRPCPAGACPSVAGARSPLPRLAPHGEWARPRQASDCLCALPPPPSAARHRRRPAFQGHTPINPKTLNALLIKESRQSVGSRDPRGGAQAFGTRA
jgi:hypothetical protein